MIKPELILDPPEPEIYTVSGKNVVVATVRLVTGRYTKLTEFIGFVVELILFL
jgi:hypothetical protein